MDDNIVDQFKNEAYKCFKTYIKFNKVYTPWYEKHLHEIPLEGVDIFGSISDFQNASRDAAWYIYCAVDYNSFEYVEKFRKGYDEMCRMMPFIIDYIVYDNMHEIIPEIIKMHEVLTKMYYRISFPGQYVRLDNGICIVLDD